MASFDGGGAPDEEWTDITPVVKSVAGGLGIDELLQGEAFSLFESMSACELMDPKMDALGDEPPQQTLEERVAANLVPLAPSLGAARASLDRLAALEAAWHGGAGLHETVLR
eukprot:CAMPEP_0119283380 /NCGR_PEP_ID=MMETSP1329-20130426/28396_1 /TAXON_ID=114041 /ORGANISM="Genus nov. species nov., Strain RCC1024" /LENGTH=111 /DNA_ID=CAMNT_0007284049 /DNA_START=145 /DNA_END=476 /DNA_ORIENTATION=-